MKRDLVVVGDVAHDTFLGMHEASVSCALDSSRCMLCLQYGEKIPVESYREALAGNAANVAVGAARLGLHTTLFSIVGDDAVGKRFQILCEQEGIATSHLLVDKGHPTNVNVVIDYQSERTLLGYSYPRSYRAQAFPVSDWLYYTAVGQHHERLEQSLRKHILHTKTKLAFNPGAIHLREKLEKIHPTLLLTEVIFVNKEEGERLAGPQKDIRVLLHSLHRLGPKKVVVTDGPRGAFAHDGVAMWHMPIIASKVVERTGAGDSFATGVLAALHNNVSLVDALRWGALNAASVVGAIGPHAGLLTRTALLARYKKSMRVSATTLV